jgi:hypothetical protein
VGAVGVGAVGTANQINNQSRPDDSKTRPINPRPAIPSAGYCNDEPPPDCEPGSGQEIANKITEEVLQQLMNDAIAINKAGNKIQPGWGQNNKVSIGISESGKKYIATTNGTYPSSEKFSSGNFQAELKRKGYIVVKNANGLSKVETYTDATGKVKQKQWHSEGRLIQNGININDRIVGMGTSDNNCRDCGADTKKFNVKSLNRIYSVNDYNRFPRKRPSWENQKLPKKKKC